MPGLDRRLRDAIYDHVFESDDHEVGGVLVGHLGSGSLPVVTGSIAALEADERRASVTFTHDTWSGIHETLERDFPEQQIVGWYHSHPGFGIFLSEYDRFIHGNFFSDQRQIAYVVDPHAGTEGVFWWHDNELTLLKEQPTSRIGTDGAGTRPERAAAIGARHRSKPDRLRYGTGAAVIVLLIALAVALVSASGSTPTVRHAGSHRTRLGAHTSNGRAARARGTHRGTVLTTTLGDTRNRDSGPTATRQSGSIGPAPPTSSSGGTATSRSAPTTTPVLPAANPQTNPTATTRAPAG